MYATWPNGSPNTDTEQKENISNSTIMIACIYSIANADQLACMLRGQMVLQIQIQIQIQKKTILNSTIW